MLAGKKNTFKVGDSADSQTNLATSQIHKFMDKVTALISLNVCELHID